MNDGQKKYNVIFHDDVKPMMFDHFRFLADVSPSAAQKLRDALYKGISPLRVMPHRCPIYREHRTSDAYRRLIIGRYQVIFSICEDEDIVKIQYILDSRQNSRPVR